ncbi:MAG: zinc ribbon domain-containing protein [Phycisphaerae bacterium]|nr:zinc ribbon domain-containing protein [Phycisphaerae bacterium]
MPTYEYRCTACDHEFEQFQSMKDKALRKCPSCGKNALERLIGTGAAVIFKGSGFYQTDYRPESYKKAAEADKAPSETAATATGKDEAKTNSKPETNSVTKPAAEPKAAGQPESKTPAKKPEKKTPLKPGR